MQSMKKRTYIFARCIFALSCACMLCFTASCGSDSDNQTENRESMIKEVSNLPDADIKIPAALIGDELADIPVVNTDSAQPENESDALSTAPVPTGDSQEPASGSEEPSYETPTTESSDDAQPSPAVNGTLDSDNNITYHLDGDTRTQLLNDLAEEIQTNIETILADKYYYPNISDIRVNSDCTEFTIYLTADHPNLYESSLMMSFYTVGDRYQIYSGIPMEDAKTTVIYLQADTGAELARTDSTSVQ